MSTALTSTNEFLKQLVEDNKKTSLALPGPTFTPQLRYFANKAEAIVDGKIEDRHYGLMVDQDIIDIGKEVPALLLAGRPRAQFFVDDEMFLSFNENSPVYAQIVDKAEHGDADEKRSAMYGLDTLIWIPKQGFATFYFGRNASHRRLARSRLAGWVRKQEPWQVVFGSRVAQNNKGKWTSPDLRINDQPFEVQFDPQEAMAALAEFRNAKDKVPEAAPDDSDVIEGEVVR